MAYFYHKLLFFFLTEKAGLDDEARRLIAKWADIEKAKEEEIHQNEQLEAQLREIHANNKALCAGRLPSFFLSLCCLSVRSLFLFFHIFVMSEYVLFIQKAKMSGDMPNVGLMFSVLLNCVIYRFVDYLN